MTTEPETPPSPPKYTEALLEKKDAKKAVEVGISLDDAEAAKIEQALEEVRVELQRKALALKLRASPTPPPLPSVPAVVETVPETVHMVEIIGENPMRPSVETLEGKLVLAATVFQYLLGCIGIGMATYGGTQGNLPIACWGAALTAMSQYLSKKIASDFARERTNLKQSQVNKA